VPDLSQKFEQQEQAPAAESNKPEADKSAAAAGNSEQGADGESPAEEAVEEEGLSWWVYALLAVANLAIIGGAVWWFLFRKKEPELAPAETSMEMAPAGDLDELDDFEDELAGDFDSLDEGLEEEIPAAPEVGGSTTDAANKPEAEDDLSSGFDEDFSIDPDDESDDSWGEFDTDALGEDSEAKPE